MKGETRMMGQNSLLQTVTQQFSPTIVQTIADKTGADRATVQKGVTLVVPLLLTAFAKSTSTPSGAESLSSTLSTNFSNPEQIPSNGAVTGVLDQAFGGHTGAVEEAVGKSVGMDGVALVGSVTPVALGGLAKAQREQGLDAQGLADQLQGAQKEIATSGDTMSSITQLLGAGAGQSQGGIMGMLGKLFGGG
jgi:Bacterial protein of unknown function (DUF937)